MITLNSFLNQDYSPPFYQFNGHIQTIVPGLFRKVKVPGVIRERWDTPDGDFIDVDWYKTKSKRLVVICHGLEGDSRRPYMLGMIKALINSNYSVLAWNFRSCSGKINRLKRFYHSGATEDLSFVIDTSISKFSPEEVYLVGFSLGGNLTLKYLGEQSGSTLIKKAVAISVPIHLESSAEKMMEFENRPYEIRFLRSLKKKVVIKEQLMPGTFDLAPLSKVSHVWDFDDIYTGPIHGFKNARDYYKKCSSIFFLSNIQVPTLLINAKNDPFLSDKCYPESDQINNNKILTYYPSQGGHCGFYSGSNKYHSEEVTIEFLQSIEI